MSNRKHPIFMALACGLLGYGIAAAQFSALDPVQTAPHIYQNVLENDRVRVLKVTERNGETPPIHSHPESLIVHLSPCAWMETAADGSEQMQSFRLGDVAWRDHVTHGGETSKVVQECSRLEIEFKSAPAP
jgi:hypothetical protein